MSAVLELDEAPLARWRAEPAEFIEAVLHDPETGKPFVLLDAEREFLRYAFVLDETGRLLYPEQVYACPKKSGKTGFAGLHMLTTILLFGGRLAEGYALANDEEQAASRVFAAIRNIVQASPMLKREAKITADRISFPHFYNATIYTVASNAATAAGANPSISCFDELWGYTSERSYRLWDEMIPKSGACGEHEADGHICGLQRREPASRKPLQARHGAAGSRSQSARWQWDADVLEP